MGQAETLSEPPVQAVFSQRSVNEGLSLGDLDVEFELNGRVHRTGAKVDVTFGRSSNLRLLLDANSLDSGVGTQLQLDESWDGKLRLTDLGQTIDVFSARAFELVPRQSVIRVAIDPRAANEPLYSLS